MDILKLLSILTDLKNDFPTIKKVEKDGEHDRITISLKEFTPKNEDKTFELSAVLFENPHPHNNLAHSYLQNWNRVEIFYFAGSYPLESSDLNFALEYLSQQTLRHMGLQMHLIKDHDDKTGSILCRSVIPLMNNPDNIQNDVLFAMKDLLAMHYQVGFNKAIGKLKDTGLDDDIKKSVIEKYEAQIQQLINPITEL